MTRAVGFNVPQHIYTKQQNDAQFTLSVSESAGFESSHRYIAAERQERFCSVKMVPNLRAPCTVHRAPCTLSRCFDVEEPLRTDEKKKPEPPFHLAPIHIAAQQLATQIVNNSICVSSTGGSDNTTTTTTTACRMIKPNFREVRVQSNVRSLFLCGH